MFRLLLSFTCLAIVVWAHKRPLPSVSLKSDSNSRLVLWGTRHGARNPGRFHSAEPYQVWGFEGELELTSIGKRQAYGLGRELRRFVGYNRINVNYLPKEAHFYSSSAGRCQATLQTALVGFYDPIGWADWQTDHFDHWSPIPYTTNDQLLRMYAVKDCPRSAEVWKEIDEDSLPELANLTEKYKDLIAYVAKQTGWQADIGSVSDIADNLIAIETHNAHYPSWIEKPGLKGYNKDSIIKAIHKFAEKRQIACADHEPCRNLMAGHWAQHIVDSIKKAQTGEGPYVIGYASHTEVTLAVMKLLGLEKKDLETSAGFVIDFRTKPNDEMRILLHDPNPIDRHVIYKAHYSHELAKISNGEGWMPIEKYFAIIEKNLISDADAACGKTCSTN
ncbi:unnamed protein product [Auanema sp. JU1783]|nr:unnamed protein product [Auanema sp. JU1783]